MRIDLFRVEKAISIKELTALNIMIKVVRVFNELDPFEIRLRGVLSCHEGKLWTLKIVCGMYLCLKGVYQAHDNIRTII